MHSSVKIQIRTIARTAIVAIEITRVVEKDAVNRISCKLIFQTIVIAIYIDIVCLIAIKSITHYYPVNEMYDGDGILMYSRSRQGHIGDLPGIRTGIRAVNYVRHPCRAHCMSPVNMWL